MRLVIILLGLLATVGCGPATGPSKGAPRGGQQSRNSQDESRPKTADINALFIGNSHTVYHDVPALVAKMMEFLHPDKVVWGAPYPVGFLEEAATDPSCKAALKARKWDFVILQAQKISSSGRYDYSTKEGIDLAKFAKSTGATVYYFSEWGRKGVADEGERTHKIYEQMAGAADVKVAPVGRAWDLALAERPELKLHGPDGNHESEVGAFLTACVLCGQIAAADPTPLGSFDYPDVSADDRKFLASIAARALKSKSETLNPKSEKNSKFE